MLSSTLSKIGYKAIEGPSGQGMSCFFAAVLISRRKSPSFRAVNRLRERTANWWRVNGVSWASKNLEAFRPMEHADELDNINTMVDENDISAMAALLDHPIIVIKVHNNRPYASTFNEYASSGGLANLSQRSRCHSPIVIFHSGLHFKGLICVDETRKKSFFADISGTSPEADAHFRLQLEIMAAGRKRIAARAHSAASALDPGLVSVSVCAGDVNIGEGEGCINCSVEPTTSPAYLISLTSSVVSDAVTSSPVDGQLTGVACSHVSASTGDGTTDEAGDVSIGEGNMIITGCIDLTTSSTAPNTVLTSSVVSDAGTGPLVDGQHAGGSQAASSIEAQRVRMFGTVAGGAGGRGPAGSTAVSAAPSVSPTLDAPLDAPPVSPDLPPSPSQPCPHQPATGIDLTVAAGIIDELPSLDEYNSLSQADAATIVHSLDRRFPQLCTTPADTSEGNRDFGTLLPVGAGHHIAIFWGHTTDWNLWIADSNPPAEGVRWNIITPVLEALQQASNRTINNVQLLRVQQQRGKLAGGLFATMNLWALAAGHDPTNRSTGQLAITPLLRQQCRAGWNRPPPGSPSVSNCLSPSHALWELIDSSGEWVLQSDCLDGLVCPVPGCEHHIRPPPTTATNPRRSARTE